MATFKTRARTLDMLGRQQIAGIPTAISELFKNAHDAYARRVEIDYYRLDRLFVLRDDGTGMTSEEFQRRWLTIGADNRPTPASPARRRRPPNRTPRPTLGEKGIGRLAIAAIGPQVLVLTRSGPSELTAAFVNWTLFECPGIDLDDIRVPLRTFHGAGLPSQSDVAELLAEFHTSNAPLRAKIPPEYSSRLDDELRSFSVDPRDIDSYLGEPTLHGTGTGTHFVICPASDLLSQDIDGDNGSRKATPLTKALLGFANTMTPSHPPPAILTAFRDHTTDDLVDDIIAEGEFFTPDEFENADHQVQGLFDDHGQFKGVVSIYGEPVQDHVIPWPGARGLATHCGPFGIAFAAVEGDGKHSTLPPEDHARMTQKAAKIGGLYIYRDGIRILPYGDTDYDWLDIEYHRTKSAYYYYFSHRKMFGAIDLRGAVNAGLSEKAGREGFRENRAYRQFKSILKNFLLQIVADFFRREGAYSDRFEAKKAELTKQELDRRRREQLVAGKRAKFADDLATFFQRVSSDRPQEETLALSTQFSERLKDACADTDPHTAAQAVLRIEQEARRQLRRLETRYRVVRPRIALSKALQRDWQDYAVAYADLRDRVFRPARELIEGVADDEVARARVQLNRQLRAEESLAELAEDAQRRTRTSSTTVRRRVGEIADEVRHITAGCVRDLEVELRAVATDFQRADLAEVPDADFVKARDTLEARILQAANDRASLLDSLLEQLDALDLSGQTSTLDQLVATEQRNLILQEQADTDLHLAQLGMAVEVINHEFNATIRSVRTNLRRLKAWADMNGELQDLYLSIRASFDHLDGYLSLFTPLQRRLYRKAVDIRGSEISKFLRDLFQERLARHEISLTSTSAFAQSRVHGFPSSFYPVFVNLVDNAIFWLSQQNPSKVRRIVLHAEGNSLLVSDSGPGVADHDRDVIFDVGFTRKPAGRGMGLHISRQTLRHTGYELSLADGAGDGTTFVIGPVGATGEEELAP